MVYTEALNIIGAVIAVVGQLGDAVTTELAFGKGFVEGNPLLKNLNDTELILVKAGAAVTGALAALLIPHYIGVAIAVAAGVVGGIQTVKTIKIL